jgi:hypothetical protein
MSYVLIVEEGPDQIIELGIGGPQGPVGPGGGVGSLAFVHEQRTAAPVWNVSHGLNLYPAHVHVFDTNQEEINGAVKHLSPNQTLISFNVAIAGTARLL